MHCHCRDMRLGCCLLSSLVKRTAAMSNVLLTETERAEHLAPLLKNGWSHIKVSTHAEIVAA